jgi:hypothetical protein
MVSASAFVLSVLLLVTAGQCFGFGAASHPPRILTSSSLMYHGERTPLLLTHCPDDRPAQYAHFGGFDSVTPLGITQLQGAARQLIDMYTSSAAAFRNGTTVQDHIVLTTAHMDDPVRCCYLCLFAHV